MVWNFELFIVGFARLFQNGGKVTYIQPMKFGLGLTIRFGF
jgi:hypothetical protein